MKAVLLAALCLGCYRGNPPWPGDPTTLPPVVTLPQPPGPETPPYLRCTEMRVDIDVDAGVPDDAGTWRYPSHVVFTPCTRRNP